MSDRRKKGKNSADIFFIIAYASFFLSLFISDIYPVTDMLETVSRSMRMVTYVSSIVAFMQSGFKRKNIFIIMAMLAICGIYLAVTKDAYLLSLVILIYSGRNCDTKKLFNIGFFLLLIGTIITILLMLIGVLPDRMVSKAFSYDLSRHSMGFYHSDVLPGIILYLHVFYVWTHNEKLTYKTLVTFVLLHCVAYYYCHSRVCFLVGILFSFLLYLTRKRVKPTLRKIVNIISKYVAVFCSIISIAGMLLVKSAAWLYKFDIALSFRLRYASMKMERIGLHFINFMDNETYYGTDDFAVDNGYLFITLRFGILFVLALIMINVLLSKKNADSTVIQLCMIAVFVAGFIDNEFLSYGFLPVIISSLKDINILNITARQRHMSGRGGATVPVT